MSTIARLTTWVAGDVLTAAALNNEFNNIVNDYNGSITQVNFGTLTGTVTWSVSSNTTAVSITDAATTADIVSVTGNSLTTGRLALFQSNSADTGTRSLFTLLNDNTAATGTTVLTAQQDAAQRLAFFDQNANAVTFLIDTEATTTNGVTLNATVMTTGIALSIPDLDALTTGSGISVVSNSADPSTRNLLVVTNDNAAATSARCALFTQDSSAEAARIVQNNNVQALVLSGVGVTTNNVLDLIDATALTLGGLIRAINNAADTGTRTLVQITNDNTAATGATALSVQQDAAQRAVFIDQNGSTGVALLIDQDSNDAGTVYAMEIQSSNVGAGEAGGINLADLGTASFKFRFVADNTDPTGAGGAATGRILIDVAGATRYLAYYT